MTLPLGQRTLRERSALRSLVERTLESVHVDAQSRLALRPFGERHILER